MSAAGDLDGTERDELHRLRGENAALKQMLQQQAKLAEAGSLRTTRLESLNVDLKIRLTRAVADCDRTVDRLAALLRGLDMATGTFDATEINSLWPEWLQAVEVLRIAAQQREAERAASNAVRG